MYFVFAGDVGRARVGFGGARGGDVSRSRSRAGDRRRDAHWRGGAL